MGTNHWHDTTADFLRPLGLALPITVHDVEQAFLAKVRTAHPDAGGDAEDFKRLQRAYEQAHEYAETHSIGWIANSVESYVAQRHLIDRVSKLGGCLDIESNDWLKHEVSEDFLQLFERVVGIHLDGPHIDDRVLSELLLDDRQAVAGLRVLCLRQSRVTYHGLLPLLCRLPKLELLGLSETEVSWWQQRKLRWSFPSLDIVKCSSCAKSREPSAKAHAYHRLSPVGA